jgi:hypothetical protein
MSYNFKKFLIIFFFLIFLPLLIKAIEFKPPWQTKSFQELLDAIYNFIFWVAIALVPIMVIVAAYFFLTSGGDPEKIRTAKKIIFWTFIGLIIVLLGKGVVAIIGQLLGGGPGPGPGCVTNGACDNNCPAGCTVAQDPDCQPCQGGNNCCGIGCDSTNDADCTTGLTKTELFQLGDITGGDCYIDILDATAMGNAFGSSPGDPNWNPDADLNKDNVVNDCDNSIISGITWHWKCGDPVNAALLSKLGDMNGDCVIDVFDLILLGDLNKDGVVDNCDKSIVQNITFGWKCRI